MSALLLLTTSIMVVATAVLGRYHAIALKNLLDARVKYRIESIAREAAEEQLETAEQQLVSTRGILNRHQELLRHLNDSRFALERELEFARRSGSERPALDDQTKALVRLATSNPNENEKHAAAMLVCKRLRERLDA